MLCERVRYMSKLIVKGRQRLEGVIPVQGAKNSALPILTAALICKGKSVIHNCPSLTDTKAAVSILEHLGCSVVQLGHTVIIDSTYADGHEIPDDLMREMRSSIVFLGAVVARCGKAELSFPGGCELGPRPIDLHLQSLRQLGLTIEEEHGHLICHTDTPLKGCEISLPIPSVGATENIMLAACTADGRTEIHNAAREPEISDLADFLNGCGAKIHGAGESSIIIDGVKTLHGAEHTVIPDRIVASTYLSAAAITGSSITVTNIIPAHLRPVLPCFTEAGCDIEVSGRSIRLMSPERLNRIKSVRTMFYPGFPTDSQPTTMAMSTTAKGTSVFVETIFDSRFNHAAELVRMGAKIKVEGKVAVVEGVKSLSGAAVEAGDLRGGAALVVAALAAEGETVISGVHHIDRGYEKIENALSLIGADIIRADDNQEAE